MIDKERLLAKELSFRKSIGRNQLLKMECCDKDLRYKLSSNMVNPVENLGTVLMRLAEINRNNLVDKLLDFDNFTHSFGENLTKETVMLYLNEYDFPNYIIKDFDKLLRNKNSKKRLRKILFLSYYGLLDFFGDL